MTGQSDRLRGLSRHEQLEITAWLPSLEWTEDSLTLSGLTLRDVAREGPAVIFDLTRSDDNARAAHRALADAFPSIPTQLHVAVKANYHGRILRQLAATGVGAEVMSELEWDIARRAGFAPASIIVNGLGHSGRFLARLSADTPRAIVVDNLGDLNRVQSVAKAADKSVPVLIRLNVLQDGATYVTLDAKLGFPLSDFDGVLELARCAAADPSTTLIGVHAHQMRHLADPDLYRRFGSALQASRLRLEKSLGVPLAVLNVGGGIESRLVLARQGLGIEELYRSLAEGIASVGSAPTTVMAELGRFITADAGVGVTTVVAVKSAVGRTWAIVDLSSNVLIPLPTVSYYPIAVSMVPGTWAVVDVGDATCAPSHLCLGSELPPPAVGDVLAVLNCGAYTTVYAELWAFPLPRIGFWDGSDLTWTFGASQNLSMFEAFYGANG